MMTKEEYLKMYELVGAAMEVYNELLTKNNLHHYVVE